MKATRLQITCPRNSPYTIGCVFRNLFIMQHTSRNYLLYSIFLYIKYNSLNVKFDLLSTLVRAKFGSEYHIVQFSQMHIRPTVYCTIVF
jgi:hypothetical protein